MLPACFSRTRPADMAGNLWLRSGATADAPVAPAPLRRPSSPEPVAGAPARASLARRLVSRPELLGLLALAALLNLWSLDTNGWANEYYSAAVRSMTGSWHNFLFGSFDPSGVAIVEDLGATWGIRWTYLGKSSG